MVVDDEPIARLALRVLLERDPEIELVADGDAAAAERLVPRERPELLFLDVHMPGLDGFELLERIGVETVPAVVFVTAWDRHAKRAFDVGAVDYLLKPFDDERFSLTLSRVKQRLDRSGPRADRLRRLMARTGDRVTMVDLDQVDWIEAADYYVQLHVGKKSYLLREPMRDLEARLDPRRFMRIHRSAIVAIDRVAELRPSAHGDHCVRLRDGTDLKLSRARRGRLRVLLAMQTAWPANP